MFDRRADKTINTFAMWKRQKGFGIQTLTREMQNDVPLDI